MRLTRSAHSGATSSPSPEEYSRVTNADRFRPLHQHALDLLVRLQASYDVTQSDTFALVPGLMRPFAHARPPVTLTPAAADAAPIAIAFTAFPGLVVRCGRWHSAPFPSYGCDACDETAAGEAERLEDLLGKVVAGLFVEEIRMPLLGDARLYGSFGDRTPSGALSAQGWITVSRDVARVLRGDGPRRIQWRPWPRGDRR